MKEKHKTEIDAGMVTLRQQLGHERRSTAMGAGKIGKEAYGDPSGATGKKSTWQPGPGQDWIGYRLRMVSYDRSGVR